MHLRTNGSLRLLSASPGEEIMYAKRHKIVGLVMSKLDMCQNRDLRCQQLQNK